jgi:hypothetical protein
MNIFGIELLESEEAHHLHPFHRKTKRMRASHLFFKADI